MHQIESMDRDLNLLWVLRVLLDEQSVSAASRRLHLSASATSHALARLRDAFGDPLLVREGNGMVPTPRALALRSRLVHVLDEAELLYRDEPSFAPDQSEREFAIAAPDLLAPVAPALVALLGREAPRASLRIRGDVGADPARLATAEVDLALLARPSAEVGLETCSLGWIDFVVVGRASHRYFRKRGANAWFAASHVVVSTNRPGLGYVGEAVARVRGERRIALRVPSFLLALHVVRETSLLFSAPGPLVRPLVKRLGLATAPLPIRVPRVEVAAVWHQRFGADPAHRWFRERVCDALTPGFLRR